MIPGLMAVRLPLGWGTVGGSGGMIPGLMAVWLLVRCEATAATVVWVETAKPDATKRIANSKDTRTLRMFEVMVVNLL
jgi:hypothetical protein